MRRLIASALAASFGAFVSAGCSTWPGREVPVENEYRLLIRDPEVSEFRT